MTVSEIRDILESPYNRKEWKGFLQTQFTNNKLNADDRIISLSDKILIKQCLSLGNYEINEYSKIGIFEVELNEKVNITRNRVALRNLVKDLTKQVASAMVVFVQGDKWRFSYISKRKIKNKDTNEIQDKETAPKRYTYLFGNGEKALTAATRFDKLIQKQKGNIFQFLSLDDFDEAFSVEKLSKEFFSKYKEIYEDLVEFITGKRYVKKSGKWVEIKAHEAHFQLRNYFDNDEKQARDFCKRMLGRIVFLYFIQKKGWLAVPREKKWGEGNPDYLFELFDNAKYKESFYSDYLVPLFFDTLNNPNVQKESNEWRFPYLNGGLFDKSQDYKYDKIALPSEIFERLFTTFNNFNFTIYEDAPDEQTVAVDPEMLGHIFENLLEDNKDKGAFYTPKDIVHYMCRESLHSYIHTYTHNEGNEDFKTRLNSYNDTYDVKLFSNDELKQIDRALEDVKICDPAIGSGAFPMGLLHEIYHLKIPIEDNKGFKAKTPADLKKHIIEESIYGVDIDSGAVDIARLRFWLSLVVDETEPQPLPNLAFKIVCANTLIPLGIGNNMQYQIAGATDVIKEIERVRHHYFDASKEEKKDLERQFKNLQNKLWNTAKDWVTSKDAAIYQRLLEFNPFEDKSCGWFDPWWMFGVKDGFDIVIGNPPYVQLQNNSGVLAKFYEKSEYKTFSRKGDLYSLFYEKGWQLLKLKGVLCFITSNGWMRNDYGENTRSLFAMQTNPILLIDFAGQKIFDSATVEVNILMFTKEKNHQKTLACIVKENVLNNLSDFVRQQGGICSFTSADSWVILSGIENQIKEKIERIGTPLKNWEIQINYGIKTGFNEAFIINGKKKDELIAEDPKSEEIIRPILRGRDIKRYGYDFNEQYLIATFPSRNYNIDYYPAVKKFLEGFKPKLKQTGETLTYKEIEQVMAHAIANSISLKEADLKTSRKKTNNKWFETQDSISYWDDFSKQKIVWGNLNLNASYTIAPEGLFVNAPCPMIVPACKSLLAILNSKLADYYIKILAKKRNGGYIEYKPMFIERLPVPVISEEQRKHLLSLVEIRESVESGSESAITSEKEIDEMIYELYELTSEEIRFIETEESIKYFV